MGVEFIDPNYAFGNSVRAPCAIRHDNAEGHKKSRGYLDQKHATRIHYDDLWQRERDPEQP
jgi:hypothetical protein